MKGLQVGDPVVPAATTVQAPSAVAPRLFAQTSQEPSHSALQQKPSTHRSPAHCAFRSQAAPTASEDTHSPWGVQKFPGVHSASLVQPEPQALAAPLQVKGRQP